RFSTAHARSFPRPSTTCAQRPWRNAGARGAPGGVGDGGGERGGSCVAAHSGTLARSPSVDARRGPSAIAGIGPSPVRPGRRPPGVERAVRVREGYRARAPPLVPWGEDGTCAVVVLEERGRAPNLAPPFRPMDWRWPGSVGMLEGTANGAAGRAAPFRSRAGGRTHA